MTERPGQDRVDTEYGERSGGDSAPRRVGDVRKERESAQDHDRERDDRERGELAVKDRLTRGRYDR